MAIIVPHDVLFHCILPRLPAKSVLRFKCVSKELHSFLSSNVFKKMHIRHLDCHQNHDKFIVLFQREPHALSTIDYEALIGILTLNSFKLPAMASSKGKITFLTSFHGLVCLCIPIENDNEEYYDLILWNPLMSEYKRLSKPNSREECHDIRYGSTLGLFYSSCEDDYKIAILSQNFNIVYIYSLKANSWRRVAFQGTYGLKEYRASQSICLNENLYFLNSYKKYSVIKFDTKTERFKEMKTSDFNDDQNRYRAILLVKNGCVHVFIVCDVEKTGFETELWKINEEGDWKKMKSYRVNWGSMFTMWPLHLTRNGNFLMLYIYRYNFTVNCKGYLRKKHIEGQGKENDTLCHDMEISEIVRYTETFVSPNQYIK